MAVQSGPNLFRGKLGGVTGYLRNNKFMLRRNSSLCLEQMLRSPRSANTFKNALEMGEAISGGSLIRQDLRGLLRSGKDAQHHNRLSGLLRRAINTDPVNRKGERNLQYSDLSSLKGYNFSLTGLLNSCYKGSYKALINRRAGVASLKLSDFVASRHLKRPAGATHFEVISICSVIDFEAFTNNTSINKTSLLRVGDSSVSNIELLHSFKKKTTDKILLMMGIRYYEEVNGEMCLVKAREFSPLSIVEVDSFSKGGSEVERVVSFSEDKRFVEREFEKMMEGIRME